MSIVALIETLVKEILKSWIAKTIKLYYNGCSISERFKEYRVPENFINI